MMRLFLPLVLTARGWNILEHEQLVHQLKHNLGKYNQIVDESVLKVIIEQEYASFYDEFIIAHGDKYELYNEWSQVQYDLRENENWFSRVNVEQTETSDRILELENQLSKSLNNSLLRNSRTFGFDCC